MGRTRRMPSCQKIAEANEPLLTSLEIDLEKAAGTCWACKYEFDGSSPERAHVNAVSHGGDDNPENFFLLCTWCHSSQPDGALRRYQVAWLRRPKNDQDHMLGSIDMVKVEFERMTGHTLQELLAILMDNYGTSGMLDRFKRVLREGAKGRAGVTYINGIANAVAGLVELWEREST